MNRLHSLAMAAFLALPAGCSGGGEGGNGNGEEVSSEELEAFVQDYMDGNASAEATAYVDRVAAEVPPGNLEYLETVLQVDGLTAEQLAADPVFIATMTQVFSIGIEAGLVEIEGSTARDPIDDISDQIDEFTQWATTNPGRAAATLIVGGGVIYTCVQSAGFGCVAAIAVGTSLVNSAWAADEPLQPSQVLDPWLAAEVGANYALPGTYGDGAFYFVRPGTPGDPSTQFAFGDWFDGNFAGENTACTTSYDADFVSQWEHYEGLSGTQPQPMSLMSNCSHTIDTQDGHQFEIQLIANHGYSGTGANTKLDCYHIPPEGYTGADLSFQCSIPIFQVQRHDLF